MKNVWKRLMVTGLAMTSFAVGTVGFAYTATSSETATASSTTTTQSTNEQKGGKRNNIDTASFVTAGTIDQATADKITAYLETQNTAREAEMTQVQAMSDSERQAYFASKQSETKTDLFSELVSQGILTQTQADTMKAATPQGGGGKHNNIDTASLVTAGTIDQATADKITAYLEAQNTAREAEMTQVQAMSDSERQAYFASKQSETKTDLFAELVSQGILTQTQADTIKASMPQGGGGKRNSIDTASLVTAGTIDQATADKITAYLEAQNTAREAEMTQVQAMSDSERQAYFASKQSETKTDPFSELVSQGILTQTQADTIKASMPQRNKNTAASSSATDDNVISEPSEATIEVSPTATTATSAA